ncbi:MAG: hypothetical protein RLZZ299_2973 [Pseudomonadota bacterium]|jgi:hypothetical protein
MTVEPFSVPWQVPADLETVRVHRVASALVAAASDAVVCLHLDDAERAFAGVLGLAVVDTPSACRSALRHGGLALLDGRRVPLTGPAGSSVARVVAHPAGPTRAVVRVDAGQGVAAARALRAAGVESALVLDPVLAATRRVCRLVADNVRVVDPGVPVPWPAGAVDPLALAAALRGADVPVSHDLAWEAAAVLWVGGWMPRFPDILGWTRSRLRAGIDLRPHAVRRGPADDTTPAVMPENTLETD